MHRATTAVATALLLGQALLVDNAQAGNAFATFESASTSSSGSRIKKILHLSDVHLNVSLDDAESATFPIKYYEDAPINLLNAALVYARQVLPDPDFFLYTGDHVVHGAFTDDFIAHVVEKNVETLEKYYPPGQAGQLEVTAIIGNADGNPDYHMDVTDPATQVNPSIELISGVWNKSLSAANFDTFNRRGYLQYLLDDKLAVLTLNTVPYSPSHVPDTSGVEDPFGQFQWLNDTLANLRAEGKFVYITGHIPPMVDSYGGNPQWHVHYLNKYKAIVLQYPDVIKAQIFGHVHSVEFRVPQPSDAVNGLELVPLFVTGSISPLFGNNPSFTVWEFDDTTYDLLDFTIYGTNISTVDQKLDWKPLFCASTEYGVKSLSTASMRDYFSRMESDPALLDAYYWDTKARSYKAKPCTTLECRSKLLCTTSWWACKEDFLACAAQEQTKLTAVDPMAAPPATRVLTATTPLLSSSDVFKVIGVTLVGTVALVASVLIVARALQRGGVLKTPADREREFEDVFPML
ncbi:TPA: hypothetical protein N0F65_006989 [Lagenidium giganteum]|uniref:Calcineurin-like phosphoesterase domain-containing protein n=1 Tax=Lagenidium giganteum TaxID=4803 RepID=A0AAV2ZEA0_9STRA|nr:TPA: hypothetical protein N0F65_006989 [Lagenidium giganteum]